MKTIKVLKWITGSIEFMTIVPVYGSFLIFIPYSFTVMAAVHLLVLLLAKKSGLPIAGNLVGIAASLMIFYTPWDWFFHLIAAILITREASLMKRSSSD
ncbi:hypothetical protein JF544_01640 [Halobacillus kuroshimensis]|uniref:Uncharacterized protein n=1 Tax=Halobacillus kuroshimensis TaxID=302481 RepID=A0ABS3DRF2_9BACI|nr:MULTISPECIES: hypothetical protein [Halobacillus]MBN8233922.1 hypothetical protein [Halobacillus kuroshimensis]